MMKISWSVTSHNYMPLLAYVNDQVTEQNWRRRLRDVEAWQLEWELGLEATDGETPRISGASPTRHKARELQSSLRSELDSLVRLSLDQHGLACQSELAEFRGGNKVWTWRKAQVLPTRQLFFDDAGEALEFLAEDLEYQIRLRAKKPEDLRQARSRQGRKPGLHLSLCACGCNQFFLWEGNWSRKQRKFLNDKHRMDFRNKHNVERKKLLARQRRGAGYYQ